MAPSDPNLDPTGAHARWDRFSRTYRSLLAAGLAIVLLVSLALALSNGWFAPMGGLESGERFLTRPSPGGETIGEPGRLLAEGRVGDVSAGDTVTVAVGNVQIGVIVSSVVAPNPADSPCRWEESLEFAKRTLSGKRVKVFTPTGDEKVESGVVLRAHVVLLAGTNYAVAALEAGAVRLTDNVNPARLARVFQSAQDTAVTANHGLWGASCRADPPVGSPAAAFEYPRPSPRTKSAPSAPGRRPLRRAL